MLGAIAGDIIGSRFEGHSAPADGFELFHPECGFTDDTVCTIAVAEALMSGSDCAETLRAFVRRHPGRGYGGLFFKWAMTDDAPAYGSWGNGAPMRAMAAGWLADTLESARRLAERQAAVSHDHPDAIEAAEAVALVIALARRGDPATSIRAHLERSFHYDLSPDAVVRNRSFDVSARGTVIPALAAALNATGWESAVRAVIARGGDCDTLACIAGGAAEALHGLNPDIATTARGYLTTDLLAVLERFERSLPAAPLKDWAPLMDRPMTGCFTAELAPMGPRRA